VKLSEGGNILIISLYVDDLIFIGNYEYMFEQVKSTKREFNMSDLGKMNYFLGVEVIRNEIGIFICQKKCERVVRKV